MPLASYAEHIRTRKNQLDKDLEHIIEKIKYAQTIEESKNLNEHMRLHLVTSKQTLEDIMEIMTDPELSEILDNQCLNKDNQELLEQLLKKEEELTKAKEYNEKNKDELKNKDSLIEQLQYRLTETKDELAKAKAKEYNEKIRDELKNKDSLIKQLTETKDELTKAKEDLELMEQLSKLSKFKKRY